MLPAQSVSHHYIAVLDSLQHLGRHYFMSGQFEDGLSVLQHGVDLVGATSAPASYIQLLLTYGHILTWQSSLITGDYVQPMAVLQDAVERADMLGNAGVQARAYDELGFCHYQRAMTSNSDFVDAATHFQQALALWERLGDIAGICTARFHVGLIAERAGQFDAAVAHFTWVHTTAQNYNLSSQQAEASRHLGFAALRAADYNQALAAFQEALTLTEAAQSQLFLPFAYASVGEVYHTQHKYIEARQYYERGAEKAVEFGVRRATVQILYCLGELAEEQQQRQAAHDYYTEAHQTAQAIHFQLGVQMTAAKLAQLMATES